MHSLVNICMPQGCDGVQLVALSIGPLCRHDITSPFPPSGNGGYVRNLDVLRFIGAKMSSGDIYFVKHLQLLFVI